MKPEQHRHHDRVDVDGPEARVADLLDHEGQVVLRCTRRGIRSLGRHGNWSFLESVAVALSSRSIRSATRNSNTVITNVAKNATGQRPCNTSAPATTRPMITRILLASARNSAATVPPAVVGLEIAQHDRVNHHGRDVDEPSQHGRQRRMTPGPDPATAAIATVTIACHADTRRIGLVESGASIAALMGLARAFPWCPAKRRAPSSEANRLNFTRSWPFLAMNCCDATSHVRSTVTSSCIPRMPRGAGKPGILASCAP